MESARHRWTLTPEQRVELIESLFENIGGKNLEVDKFIKDNNTPDPAFGRDYYPMSIVFLFGFDQIEITFSDSPMTFVLWDSDKFLYEFNNKRITLPGQANTNRVIQHTFNFTNKDDSRQFRSMIKLMYGDCKIIEHKL